MSPSIVTFNVDVLKADFQTGIDKGMWGVVDDDSQRPSWPVVIIWIQARPKTDCPDRYFFKFNLDNYPESAPTASFWDDDKKEPLPEGKKPKGDEHVT